MAEAYGAPSLSFHDILSFSDADVLAAIPRPVLSLIFLSPPKTYQHVRAHSTPAIPDQRAVEAAASVAAAPSSTPIWIPQTIGHACGTMALIHSVANGPAQARIQPASILGTLLAQMRSDSTSAGPKEIVDPDARAKLLYDSAELERAHMSVANGGDTLPPDPREPSSHHFIAFVKDDRGYLWELEGGVQGPICRGRLEADEDCLSESAVRMSVGLFVEAGSLTGEVDFSCVAVVAE